MKQFLGRTGLLVLVLTLTLSAFAKPKTTSITLYHDASLSGTNLPAGEYIVKYDVDGSNAQVKFLKGNKEVASASGQVKTLTRKPGANQLVFNNSGDALIIGEIDFGGNDTAISFESAGTATGK
ncbi:MAG TPA: hypothetical protein VII23_14050 [Terriglobales bacterium]